MIKLGSGDGALFWQHDADGSRVLVLARPGARYEKLAAISRGPVKGWVIQAESGMLIGCERYRRRAMVRGEEWATGQLRIEHLRNARERQELEK